MAGPRKDDESFARVILPVNRVTGEPWYRDIKALRFIALRYLPLFALLNFAWEWAHIPLYTIWQQAPLHYIAFSVAHCTVGDVLIGLFALLLALVFGRARGLEAWNRSGIAAWSSLLGISYTISSEWLNVTVLRTWTYAESMPTLAFGSFSIGVTPLLQWLIVPPLTLYIATGDTRMSRLC